MKKPWAIILAAGQGTRLAHCLGTPKQFFLYCGVPLYWHSVRTFARCPKIGGILVVLPEDAYDSELSRIQILLQQEDLGVPLCTTRGGRLRQDSVRLGLKSLDRSVGTVLVHDAARPFVTGRLIVALCDRLAEGSQGVIPVLAVTDTIKCCTPSRVCKTLPREELYRVQTPQGFVTETLRAAHSALGTHIVTDDAQALEYMNIPVDTVQGEGGNIKITNPEDLRFLRQTAFRTCAGMGYDVHRFGGDRPVILGGVPIPSKLTIEAHSDGDVLLHALMDALLGAAALGDIGEHFPDSDPKFLGISSSILLDQVLTMLRQHAIVPVHVDATIVAQAPRIAPYREQIRKNIARLMTMDPAHINIKATTEERLGFTGRLEGIKATCLVTCQTTEMPFTLQ